MRCAHTGLPTVMCGHCNGSHPLDPVVGRSKGIPDEPHLFKGRGKVEWRGRGRSVQAEPCAEIANKALCKAEQSTLPNRSCVRHVGFSSWAKGNALRSLELVTSRSRR